ncbi:hypothetical protein ACOMHN_031165 [Nucella lapillus]
MVMYGEKKNHLKSKRCVTAEGQQEVTKRESNKRKFRPFSAVRKLFGGEKSKRKTSREEEGDAAPTTKDRPASAPVGVSPDHDRLENQRQSLADNDGGVSEGSVTSPDRNEGAMTSSTNVPTPVFKAELAGKLSKRRSLCSEEEEEDGLRQGLVPPVVVTDAPVEGSVQD